MITLEQMRLLEQKIEAAVQKISALTRDNASLQAMCDEFDRENTRLQNDMADAAAEIAALKSGQSQFQAEREQLEQVVLHAIERLEAVETTVLETVVNKAEWESAPAPVEAGDVYDSKLAETTVSHVRDSEPESPTVGGDQVHDSEPESPAGGQYIPFGAPRPEDVATAAIEIASFTPGDSGINNDVEPSDRLDLF